MWAARGVSGGSNPRGTPESEGRTVVFARGRLSRRVPTSQDDQILLLVVPRTGPKVSEHQPHSDIRDGRPSGLVVVRYRATLYSVQFGQVIKTRYIDPDSDRSNVL